MALRTDYKTREHKPAASASVRTPLIAIGVEDLLTREIKPREMLLEPILPTQGLAMLYSKRGIGKTHLGLGIAVAVASGGEFLRWKAPNSQRVLYIDGELPCVTLRDWAASIIAGSEAEVLPGNLKFITPDLQVRCIPDLSSIAGQEQIEEHIEGVTLLILDNLSALVRGVKENEGEGWLSVQEWALALRRRGISVLFVHHAGKNGAQRGTSRREDLLDTVITLKHPADYATSEGLRCEVHFEKTRAMLGDAAKPFEARMASDKDGKAVWTCRDLEDAKMQQAAALYSSGMSVRDVAEELGVSKSTAHRFRQSWRGGGFDDVSQRPTV